MATPTLPQPAAEAVPLEKVLADLRKKQKSLELAEQRHQFLDIDPDLADHWIGVTVRPVDTQTDSEVTS